MFAPYARTRAHERAHGALAALTAGLFVLASIVVPAVSASAANPAALRNLKSASVTDTVPGQSFNWVDEVGCSVLTDECINAVFTDTMPSEFTVGDASTILITGAIDPSQYTITVVGQLVTIHFSQPLISPIGAHGLANGTVTITIPVTTRSDLDASASHAVTNTSSIVADNAPVLLGPASVNLSVPLQLASSTSKAFAPASNITSAGVPTTLTLGGTNTSNTAVDTLVVQDPVTPAAGDIFGTTLVVSGALGTVTWPAGATSATVALWDTTTSSWVSATPVASGGTLVYPAGVTLTNARGVRITFTSGSPAAIPRNATASFPVALKNRSGLGVATVSNTAQSTVLLGVSSASSTATASYSLTAASTTVAAGKSITPTRLSTVAYGASDLTTGTVSLTATNSGSVQLKSLSISEPTDPTSLAATNPLAPAHIGGGLIFSGFTAAVSWPAGATGVSVTYYYDDGTNSTAAGTTTNAIPAPTVGKRVTGFLVTFTGAMPKSAIATVPYKITANPLQVSPNLSVLYSNTITVNGTDIFDTAAPAKTATATVTVLADQLTVATTKTSTATDLIAAPGQTTLVTLKSTIAAYPDSTQAATEVDIVDPSVEIGLNTWYTYFNATGINSVQVPVGATLTVQYRDIAGVYQDIPGFMALPSATYTQAFPPGLLDSIYGVKFIFKSTTGFVPSSSLTANLQYALRSTLRGTVPPTPLPNADVLDGSIANCSASQVSSGTIVSNRALSACITVKLHAFTGGGTAAFITKAFIITGAAATVQPLIVTRNLNTIRTRLSWSTGGYTNVNSMVIYDGPTDPVSGAPDPTQWQKGMFDAFALQSIPSITNALDPLGQYDQLSIEVYNRLTGLWEPVVVGGATAACSTAVPCVIPQTARTLNATQQSTSVAIRFTFTEKPGRATGGTGPAPGSGVAASFNRNRNIDLIWQLRNTLLSSSTTPVVNGYRYNVDVPVTLPATYQSNVLNNTQATATLASGPVIGTASATIALQDPNLALNATKVWNGGPLAIPDTTTPITAPAPTGRVTITSVNQTLGAVSNMSLAEPNTSAATPNDNPFDKFDLKGFVSFTNPAGSTALTITVHRSVGGDLTTASTATALAWTTAQLADATGFQIAYTGNITGTATAVFDLALRRALRSDSSVPVPAGTVYNSSLAGIADLRYDPTSPPSAPTFILTPLSKPAGASTDIFSSSIAVTAAKTFTPTSQTEPSRTAVKMDLIGVPTGTERVATLTITDDRASFWNAFDYLGISGTMTLPVFAPNVAASQMVVRPEFCVGRVMTASDVAANPSAVCTDAGSTGTAGHWVVGGGVANAGFETQATITASGFILPAGVTAAQVSGVRFTVKRLDGSQWENPQAPTIDVPVSVQRRLTLHTGGTVLTDYTGNAAAPGETAAGSTTNAVTEDIVGAYGHTGSSTVTAIYKFLHAPSGVEVKKTPSGAKAPGQIFNYQLSIKNTQSWPIVNPVITDYLPTDSGGAMLIFDPDHPTVYTYALTGTAPVPANGPALPNGTTGATVALVNAGPGPSQITFTFPASTVLEVGQTFVITIPMEFRAGLVYSTPVTNTFGISGDRVLDTCTAPIGYTATYKPATNQCITGTTVVPAQQPSLRAFISTKAVVDAGAGFPDQGFTGGTVPDCTAAEVDGFSRLPCVPLTLPGQQEIWRLIAQNTGTTQMPRLVLATRLPVVGDATILDGFLRQSAWKAGFNGTIVPNIGIPGAVITTYYTTAAIPCAAVLQNPSNLAACPSDPATGWALLTGTVDPTTVTGLQFVIDFDPTHYFQPSETLSIDVTTTTAALSSTADPDTTANNSLSASARSITGASVTNVTALDYSKVSVGLATGSVLLDKSMIGAAASFVPAGQTFTGQLVCTSLTQVTTRNFSFTWNGTVMVPAVAKFDNLPGGASCTVTETPASGQTTYTATTVIVNPLAAPAALPQVHLVNDYDLAGLTISKIVTTTAPVIPTGYHFTTTCTFLGASITLATADANFTLDANGSHTIKGLPVNAQCTVVEDDAKGANATVVTGNTGTGGSATFTDATRTAKFVLGQDPNLATTGTSANNVQYDNRFDAPAVLSIQKSFAGDAAAQFGSSQTSYTVHVLCTFGSTTQYDANVVLLQSQGFKATVQNLIAGSVCAITEPDLQNADAVVITPNNGVAKNVGSVTIPDTSTTVETVATNWFLTGSLQVTKVFAGDAAAVQKFAKDAPAPSFELTLQCTLRSTDVTIPGGKTRTVTAASPVANYSGIASGAACTLSETGTGGASSWRVTDAGGTTVTGGAFTVAVVVPTDLGNLTSDDQPQPPLKVENTYHWATVSATKTVNSALVDGNGNSLNYGNFTFVLACTLNQVPISPLESATQKVAAGGTVTWTQLAEGAECTVTETDARGATSTSYSVVTDTGAGPSTPGTNATLQPLRDTTNPIQNLVAFTNTYDPASLTITKNVTTTATVVPAAFHFTVVCTFLGNPLVLAAADAAFTLNATQSHIIKGLPTGASCLVTEDDPKGADATVVTGTTGGSATFTDATRTAQFVLSADAAVTGAVTNTTNFQNLFGAPAQLSIQKSFDGSAAAQFGESQSTFTVHVLCTFGTTSPVQFDGDVVLHKDRGWKATLANIIAGSVCTITELNRQGADAVVITPNNGTDTTTGVVIVPATPTVVQVNATNWYLTGSLAITKTFAGDDGAIQKFGIDSGSQYQFSVACVRGGQDVTIPGGNVQTVTGASPVATFSGIASGALCTISELTTGGAVSSRILDHLGNPLTNSQVTIAVDPAVLSTADQVQSPLSIENTFNFAEVSATKTVSQSTKADHGSFGFTLTCTLAGSPITAHEPATQTVAAGATVTWTQLAQGAVCSLVETDARGATKTDYALTTPSGTPGTPSSGRTAVLAPLRGLADIAPNHVAFINTYSLAFTGGVFDGRIVFIPLLLLFAGGAFMGAMYLRRRQPARHAG